MKTNVEALKALYLKLGGSLTDTYSDIAGGIPVGEYDLISDCILACAKKGGGGSITIDTNPTEGSANAVSSGGVYTALSGKQATLTFDDEPTMLSDNPVKSNGIAVELAKKTAKLEVQFTVDMAHGTVSTLTSIADIYAAYNANKVVVGKVDFGNGFAEARLAFCGADAAYFVGVGNLGYGDLDLYFDGTHGGDTDTWVLRIGGTNDLTVPLNSVSGTNFAVTNIITAYQMGYNIKLLLDDLYNLPLVYINAGSAYFGGVVAADNGGTLTVKNVVVRGTSGSPDTWTIEGLT